MVHCGMRALSLSAVLLCGCSQYLDFSSTRTAVDAQIGDAGLDARSLDAPTDAVAEDVLNEVGFDAGVDARGNRDVGVDSDIASDVGID